MNFRKKYGLRIIFFQALLATLWSLYYGFYGDPLLNTISGDFLNPANGLQPCTLCRYARILMYPIVILSLVGIITRKYASTINYILPLVILGIPLEIYHYILQKFPIQTSAFCTRANPCSALEVNYLGFITIPFLCLTAFLVILVVSLMVKRAYSRSAK